MKNKRKLIARKAKGNENPLDKTGDLLYNFGKSLN